MTRYGHLRPHLSHRLIGIVVASVAVTVLGAVAGITPAVAAPVPVPSAWSKPLPGYDPSEVPITGPLQAFTYEAAPQLLVYADQDPPKAADLGYLTQPRKKYTFGTLDRMLAGWRDILRALPAGRTPEQIKLRWQQYVANHVQGVDNVYRGDAYASFVFDKAGIAGSKDYTFGKPIPYASIEPDAFPLKDDDPDILEVKDAKTFDDHSRDQLQGLIQTVNATEKRAVYVFREVPQRSVLTLIDKANRQTKYNASLKPGETPVPAIVVRYMPAMPQPVPMKQSQASAAPGNTPGSTPGGGNPAPTKGGPGPVQPKGGAGVMVAPSSGQLPVTGGLESAIESSPDSPEEAATRQADLEQLADDLGDDNVLGDAPLGGVDFSTLELRYLSDTYQGGSGVQYAFSAQPGPADQPSYGGRSAALLASDAFFVWLELPTSSFTVNLNPDEPNRIIDAKFGQTDAGRVLLEADLQMKKYVAKLIHPDTPAGAQYWAALSGDTKCVSMRQWIVPAPATVREDNGQLYILDAPLQVKMETDYVKTAGAGGTAGCTGQSQADTTHNEQVYRSTILPQVEKAVNTAPEFADLRRVYVSRVAAQWYRERSRTKTTAYGDLVDKGNVSNWPSRTPWTPKEVFDQYVQSYTRGEFNVTHTTQDGNVIRTDTYVYGGVDFSNIPRTKLAGSAFTSRRPALAKTATAAAYAPTTEAGTKTLWLGGESTSRPLPEIQAGVPKATSMSSFWIVTTVPLLLWVVAGALLLVRRRRTPGAAR